MRQKIRILFLILAAMLTVNMSAAKQSVTIEMQPKSGKLEAGSSFYIIITSNNVPGEIQNLSSVPGCKINYAFPENGESIVSINGQTTHDKYTKVTLTCKAVTPGKYTFGPVTVGKVSSNKISYEIVAAGSGSSSQGMTDNGRIPDNAGQNSGPVSIGRGNEEMFLRASVSKGTVYEQEAIVYTLKLYSSYEGIEFIGATAAPKFEGFLIEESDQISDKWVAETYNGKGYITAVVARYIIFPQKAGRLKVKGNTYTISTRKSNYYYDPYFSQFGGMVDRTPVQLNITPNDIEIDVKPLPSPIPADFIGAVGTGFSISSDMPQTNLQTNTAASLVYHVFGTGNIKYVKLPDLSDYFPSSIEVYSPKVTTDTKVTASDVTGSVNYDYLIMPMEEGNLKIPALEFSYFDPETATYKKIQTRGYNLDVSLGKASDKSQQAAKFDPKLMPVGKLRADTPEPYISGWLYWLWFVIPVIIYVLSLGWYRKYLREHEDMQALRSKNANKMALKRLSSAYKFMQNNKEEEFYDAMLTALWGYLGDKLKMPVSELTRSNVGDEFKSHGISESTFQPIINLIDECEFAKYTPVSRKANMRQLYDDALISLSEVESEFTAQRKKQINESDKDQNDYDYDKEN